MLMPCEIAVKSLVPSIRAYLANELIQTYDMRQVDVAALLGITQTAISKYTNQIRGAALEINQTEEIANMLKDLASKLAEKQINQEDLVKELCHVCLTARRIGLMCDFCKRADPQVNPDCNICKTISMPCEEKKA